MRSGAPLALVVSGELGANVGRALEGALCLPIVAVSQL